MDTLEHFIISLAKEGLSEGRLKHRNKEYLFSKTKGVANVDVKELAPITTKVKTEKREPDLKVDRLDIPLRDSGKRVKKSRFSFKYLIFLAVFVSAVLLVVFVLPTLTKKTDYPSAEDSLWKEAVRVESIEGYKRYLENYPEGHFSLQAVARIEQLKQTEEKQREVADSGEAFKQFVILAEQALEEKDLGIARKNLDEAKKLQENPETEDLEKRLSALEESENKDMQYGDLIKQGQEALSKDNLDEASRFLEKAKAIRVGEETRELEAGIGDRKNELNKKIADQKVDEVYNRYYFFATNYFREGKYDKALENIRKARQLKDTPELNSFESQVRRKLSDRDKPAVEKKQDDGYKKYYEAASQQFNEGKYDEAMGSIMKAREIKETPELSNLEKEIIRVKEGLERERKRIENEKKKTKVETVKIIDLPPQLINTYNQAIKTIVIFRVARYITAIGQISLTLVIRPDGRLSIQQFNDSALDITPPRARDAVKSRILRKVNSIALTPPIDKKGLSVGVENWRISYSVGTFRNRIILRRRF